MTEIGQILAVVVLTFGGLWAIVYAIINWRYDK